MQKGKITPNGDGSFYIEMNEQMTKVEMAKNIGTQIFCGVAVGIIGGLATAGINYLIERKRQKEYEKKLKEALK